jgi:hypothetical protein
VQSKILDLTTKRSENPRGFKNGLKLYTLGRSDKALGRETSRTLDYLLTGSGYNRRIRPQFGGDPIQVPQVKTQNPTIAKITNHLFSFLKR